MAKILVVDDEKSMRRSLTLALETWGHETREAKSGSEALEMIAKEFLDVVITDLVMEGMDGLELLEKIRSLSVQTGVILMSGYGTVDRAVQAMKLGAHDFLVKPFSMDQLELVVAHILEEQKLRKTIKHLKAVLAEKYPFEDIVAVSPKMKEVLNQVAAVSDSGAPVLILGESGSGKELVAGAIHHLSERHDKPFVPMNCGAFPEPLLDSELFGHAKGSFTGAVTNKRGLIEEANGGTLFLDEIGEAPGALQVRLLRFLDNGRYRSVGETEERQSDVRIIAATNRSLEEDILQKKFRQDLYYRLAVTVLAVPPLRERPEDVQALSLRFLQLHGKRQNREGLWYHPQVMQLFLKYPWPGNVRELENTVEHAVILSKGNEITLQDLPARFSKWIPSKGVFSLDEDMSLEEMEKRYILSTLEKTGGNRKKAAQLLKISRTTLISRLKTYGIMESRES